MENITGRGKGSRSLKPHPSSIPSPGMLLSPGYRGTERVLGVEWSDPALPGNSDPSNFSVLDLEPISPLDPQQDEFQGDIRASGIPGVSRAMVAGILWDRLLGHLWGHIWGHL